MRDSYAAGAKYITIFNYPYNYSSTGIMGDEHFDALERLWNNIEQQKIVRNPQSPRSAPLTQKLRVRLPNRRRHHMGLLGTRRKNPNNLEHDPNIAG